METVEYRHVSDKSDILFRERSLFIYALGLRPIHRMITFSECAQPMSDGITILHHLLMAGPIHRTIPVLVVQCDLTSMIVSPIYADFKLCQAVQPVFSTWQLCLLGGQFLLVRQCSNMQQHAHCNRFICLLTIAGGITITSRRLFIALSGFSYFLSCLKQANQHCNSFFVDSPIS